MFENHRKSLIQHCERSELRLQFELTKAYQKCPKWSNLASFWKTWSLRPTQLKEFLNETFCVIFKPFYMRILCFSVFLSFSYLAKFVKIFAGSPVSNNNNGLGGDCSIAAAAAHAAASSPYSSYYNTNWHGSDYKTTSLLWK